MRDRQMQVCTHQSRFALVSMAFQLRNAKKYTGYCIIACVPMWWGKVDSNHRRHCQQIYSLSHLATLEFPHIQLRWSWWTDSNPRPADYKRWSEHQYINFRCFSQLSCRGFGSIQACCVHPEHTLMFQFGAQFGSNGHAL